MVTPRKPCRPRHLYRGKLHTCTLEPSTHWHVTCRRCRFEWLQLTLFEVGAA